jgi:hypothetical protein
MMRMDPQVRMAGFERLGALEKDGASNGRPEPGRRGVPEIRYTPVDGSLEPWAEVFVDVEHWGVQTVQVEPGHDVTVAINLSQPKKEKHP